MNHPTDYDIIQQVLAGREAAYRVLVNKYSSRVFTLVYNIVLNRQDAEEVAQDTFVKAFASLRTFRQEAKFYTWLYRIAVNTALNKKKKHRWITGEITDQITGEEAAICLPEMENKDIGKFVRAAVSNLPGNERICVTLFYLNELSVAEINELTGISIANIKVLLHRGRKHIYEGLNSSLKKEMDHLK